MENSKLENAPNKFLLMICNKIFKKLETTHEGWDSVYDDGDATKIYYDVLGNIGYTKDIDVDYIFNIISNNIGKDFDDEDTKLDRPKLTEYEYIHQVEQVVYNTVYFSNTLYSYTEDWDYMVRRRISFDDNEGNIHILDGDVVDVREDDLEINDIKLSRIIKK